MQQPLTAEPLSWGCPVADLTSRQVSQSLAIWAKLNLALTPKEIVELPLSGDGASGLAADTGLVWLISMQEVGVTSEEWAWVTKFVRTEPGRRFYPKVPEVADLIRERRRRRLDEMVGIGVERDGKTAVEWKHLSELPDPQVEAGPRVALPDLSKLGSKVVRS